MLPQCLIKSPFPQMLQEGSCLPLNLVSCPLSLSVPRSLAVHPDMVTIATGQVAGTTKEGKVRQGGSAAGGSNRRGQNPAVGDMQLDSQMTNLFPTASATPRACVGLGFSFHLARAGPGRV